MYAAELRSRAKHGYVHSLSCDPVKFSQDLGRANRTIAFTQNRRLLASKPTSDSPNVDSPPFALNPRRRYFRSGGLWDTLTILLGVNLSNEFCMAIGNSRVTVCL